MLQTGAEEKPGATILAHRETVGQRQVVENSDIARGAQGGAAQCHTVERAIGTVQDYSAAACHGAILDGAVVQRAQPARTKQPGVAYVQRCARVIQCAGDVDAATAAAEVRGQGVCLECAPQVQGATVNVDLAGVRPGAGVQVQRAAADIYGAAIGKSAGCYIEQPTRRRAQRATVGKSSVVNNGELLPGDIGIDGAGIDDGRLIVLTQIAVAL